jgi:hypothetical protein
LLRKTLFSRIKFKVPVKYVGDKINVRYDPNSLEKAYIFSDEGKVLETIYPINKIDNSKIIRNQNVKTANAKIKVYQF